MMGHKFSAAAAVLAAMAFMGCSAGDHSPQTGSVGGGKDGSMSFNLLASSNVQINAINYDLNTQAGADVVDGSIPVPSDQSQHVPVLGIQSLSSGDYSLKLSATGTLPDGTSVPCTSPVQGFHVNSGANTFVGDVTMTCSITTQVDATGSLTADVSVTTVTNTVGSVLETFAYGPRSVSAAKNSAGACVFPPVALKIASANPAIAYSWAATPDGTFTLNSTDTQGTYNCASDGDKTLTLTGVLNGQTSTKAITVHCDATACNFQCGNGILEPGEQCDDGLPHCQACKIVPVCGDNIIDSPETCEPPNTATCSATCQSIVPTCGDGVVNQASEQCDNGAADSNTTPNACRTNCQNPSCGDGVVDTGEQCDPPNGTTCTATCQTNAPPPPRDVACLACIEASASDGSVQAQYCDSDAACLTTEKCEIDQACFNPLPAFCYCGTTDVTACSAPAFTPIGLCASQIRAGEPTATDNSTALQQLFDFTVSSGIATDILNDVFTNAPQCKSLCF